MKEKELNTTLVDKAIAFATNAHKNTERRGKGFPYIVHPLEAMTIVATMTTDQKLLAAAVLHDVVEDTNYTIEDIEREFGPEVASIVSSETSLDVPGASVEDSWRARKTATLEHLAKASKEAKIVALGDKLSNIRTMKQDYIVLKDELWNRFHSKNPKDHAWYYLSLVESLSELKEYSAFKEFEEAVHFVFDRYVEFELKEEDGQFILKGAITKEDSFKLEKAVHKGLNILNFDLVTDISFGAIRTLVRMHENGVNMAIRLVPNKIASKLDDNGVSNLIPVTKKYGNGSLDNMYISGDGYTSTTYFSEKDDDVMVKLFSNIVPPLSIEKEKVMAKYALEAGLNTPISGELAYYGDKIGFSFERILNKISFSRAIANNPEKLPEYAKMFADVTRSFHALTPAAGIFPTQYEVVMEQIENSKTKEDTKEELRKLAKEYADDIHLIHGDYHTGNVIMTDKGETLVIDLADLAIGSKYYDLGALYWFAHYNHDDRSDQIFHFDVATFKKLYDLFIPFYFQTNDEKILEKEEKIIKKFAAFRYIYNFRYHKDIPLEVADSLIKNALRA